MGNIIAEFGGRYLEWSSVVDAPTTYLMTEDELKLHLLQEYGYKDGLQGLDERLERVRKFGTSSRMGSTKEDLLQYNRAGEGEAQLTTEAEIVARYSRPLEPAEEERQPSVDVSKPLELVDRFGFLGVRGPIVEILSVVETCVLAKVKLELLPESVIILFETMYGDVLSKNFLGDFKVQNAKTKS